MREKRIQVIVDPETHGKFRTRCFNEGLSIGEVVVPFIEDFANYRDKEKSVTEEQIKNDKKVDSTPSTNVRDEIARRVASSLERNTDEEENEFSSAKKAYKQRKGGLYK